jgi:hypothetical protein
MYCVISEIFKKRGLEGSQLGTLPMSGAQALSNLAWGSIDTEGGEWARATTEGQLVEGTVFWNPQAIGGLNGFIFFYKKHVSTNIFGCLSRMTTETTAIFLSFKHVGALRLPMPKYHTQTISYNCHLRMNEENGYTQRF